MPETKRSAGIINKSEQMYYLSSIRDALIKINILKEKFRHSQIERKQSQEIQAAKDKNTIQNSHGNILISKNVEGLLFALLQLEKHTYETHEYIKQYELNNLIMAQKLKNEIDNLIEIKRILFTKLQLEYNELQKKKAAIEAKIIMLIQRISTIKVFLSISMTERRRQKVKNNIAFFQPSSFHDIKRSSNENIDDKTNQDTTSPSF